MTAEIEKGIPIPPPSKNGGSLEKWPFRHLEIGDSFVMEGKENNVRSQVTRKSTQLSRSFTVRKVGPNQFRVWRTA
jgi:hypothetical protein